MRKFIKSIQANVTRSRHYGASGIEEFSVTLTVQVDNVVYRKKPTKNIRIIGNIATSDLETAYGFAPYKWYTSGQKDRAKKGIKTLKFQAYCSKKDLVEVFGMSQDESNEWCMHKRLDLYSKCDNVIYVDFVNKKAV